MNQYRAVPVLPTVLLLIGLLGCGAREAREEAAAVGKRPDVFLIVIDTLRADHLGTYGYQRPTSPAIDAFAEGATVFESAYSQAPHTIPSLLQMMSSRYEQGRVLADETPTLAEMLLAAGYSTAAVVENANLEFQRQAHGLRRGFQHFYRNGVLDREDINQQHWKTVTPADAVTAQAERLLSRYRDQSPLFFWLHYFDPHDPYLPPYAEDMEELSWQPESRLTGDIRSTELFLATGDGDAGQTSPVDRRHLVNLYDAEIRYLDRSLTDLFASLRRAGRFEKALIVITADHGESLGEHGHWTHGTALYEEQVHVPLIVKYPGQHRGLRVSDPVEILDVTPTVLAAAGVEAPTPLDGQPLRGRDPRPAFVFWKDEWVVRDQEWKLLHREGTTGLYHIGQDPDETRDMAAQHPEVMERLMAARQIRLREINRSSQELEAATEEAMRSMKSLGYLN